jgi:hypothetical protein
MSSNLIKILRSLKGHSDHHNHYGHRDHYGNHHDMNSPHDHHYKSHGKHFFSVPAFEVVRELSGKLFHNKRLALLAIIALLTIAAVFMVFGVWLVATLIKLSGPLISDMEKNGLKGVLDTVSKIIVRIWEGSGK